MPVTIVTRSRDPLACSLPGKFQMQVIENVGHHVHEDSPGTSIAIHRYHHGPMILPLWYYDTTTAAL